MFTLFFYLWWDWHIVVGFDIVAHNDVWRKGKHCFVPTNGGEVNLPHQHMAKQFLYYGTG